jgi:hypothetical protein
MLYKRIGANVSIPIPLPWYVKLLKKPDNDGAYIWKTKIYLPYTDEWRKQEENRPLEIVNF